MNNYKSLINLHSAFGNPRYVFASSREKKFPAFLLSLELPLISLLPGIASHRILRENHLTPMPPPFHQSVRIRLPLAWANLWLPGRLTLDSSGLTLSKQSIPAADIAAVHYHRAFFSTSFRLILHAGENTPAHRFSTLRPAPILNALAAHGFATKKITLHEDIFGIPPGIRH